MHEPAVDDPVEAVEATAQDVRELRRWLWERFNVRELRRGNPPALLIRLWAGDVYTCAQNLRQILASLVARGLCPQADAAVWGRLASLHGRKVAKIDEATRLGVSLRGLDGRLAKVERLIAEELSDHGAQIEISKLDVHQAVIVTLVESVIARGNGLHDIADGYYSAAAELAVIPVSARARPVGDDRTKRNRAKSYAHASAPLISADPVADALKQPDAMTFSGSFRLADDPDDALNVLEDTWRAGQSSLIPLALAQAKQLVGGLGDGEAGRRRRLHEVGSNIFRDAESLEALAWTTSWIAGATSHDADALRARINGRKTRAHVLQLHGFIDAATEELAAADAGYRRLPSGVEDHQLLGADLIVRRAAVDLLRGRAHRARESLSRLRDSEPPPRMHLSALRYELHAASALVATRQRRTFAPKRAKSYHRALEELLATWATLPDTAVFSVLDTIIASAIRVGDVLTVRDLTDRIDWDAVNAAPNVAFRLRARFHEASAMPSLQDLRDITIDVPDHPLRSAHLIPHHLRYLL